jgi:hypothetical protein
MSNNHYEGCRTRMGCMVSVNGRQLKKRLDLRNHSPDGFNWGYGGSGPAQLALAILAQEFGDEKAQRHYQLFKREVIAGLGNQWSMSSYYLDEWMVKTENKAGRDEATPDVEGGAT